MYIHSWITEVNFYTTLLDLITLFAGEINKCRLIAKKRNGNFCSQADGTKKLKLLFF